MNRTDVKEDMKTDVKDRYDVIVIGAGAVGCAVARELSRYELSVAVLEKDSDVAGETTGRNSAVVHAGFNNVPGSMMASLCVEGNRGFEEVCRQLDVPYRQTGKLIVALEEGDEQRLERLLAQGRKNGCRDLRILEREELKQVLRERGVREAGPSSPLGIEAAGRWRKALWSPHTAITNPFLYCVAMAENALANGARFYLDTEVTRIRPPESSGDGPIEVHAGGRVFRCRYLVNCAGLQADLISAMAGVDRYRIHPCRGEYFILDRPVREQEAGWLPMPIYPAPRDGQGGLGVHLTPTIEGNVMIGPSADYIDARDDYACLRPVMDELMRQARQLLGLEDSPIRLRPIGNYSGIRPKLAPPGEGGYHDFVIRAEEDVPGLIDLIGIESPGLTASVPIARRVCRMIDGMESDRRKSGLRRREDFRGTRQGILRFREQSPRRQEELIAEDPDYGEIICRCQKITKKEIRQAIENPLGARSLSAVKYRAWATTGRCSGGYCMPRIVRILVEEYGVEPDRIRYRNEGSEMFVGRVK